MFCVKCGREICSDHKFCMYCGAKAEGKSQQKAMQRIDKDNTTSPGRSRLPNKKVIALILIITAVSVFLLLKGSTNKTNFNITYSPEGVEKFLNIVCKNIDGEYARVTDPNYDGPAGSSCYTAEVEVKPKNSVAEKVQMRFFNRNDSDMVSYGKVIFYDSDSKNEFNCRKIFIAALEKTLSGTTYAEDYITSYDEISRRAVSLGRFEPEVIAEYWLTDELKVEISCEHSFSWGWYLYYTIKNIDP